jgi:hypothetical protein
MPKLDNPWVRLHAWQENPPLRMAIANIETGSTE